MDISDLTTGQLVLIGVVALILFFSFINSRNGGNGNGGGRSNGGGATGGGTGGA